MQATDKETIKRLAHDQLAWVLTSTDFEALGQKYSGKVRDNYVRGNMRFLIATDRLSCFDVVVTAIPFKGQVLTQLAYEWFKRTEHIAENHIIDMPDANVVVARNCEVIPVEVVVRGYLAGSAWRDYQAGNLVSGVELPKNLRKSERLPAPVLTPSTKEALGSHDQPIAERDMLARGLVERREWEEIREKALALFEQGSAWAAQRGLILVDTKYEFGRYEGRLILVDEIHTLDSSRYWRSSTYQDRFERGEDPEMLDKQPVRDWLVARGFRGEGKAPAFPDEERVSIALHYISAFEEISGLTFSAEAGAVQPRIERNLKQRGYLV